MAAVTVCTDFGAQGIKFDSYGVREKYGESCSHLAQDALYLSSRILRSTGILQAWEFSITWPLVGWGCLRKDSLDVFFRGAGVAALASDPYLGSCENLTGFFNITQPLCFL